MRTNRDPRYTADTAARHAGDPRPPRPPHLAAAPPVRPLPPKPLPPLPEPDGIRAQVSVDANWCALFGWCQQEAPGVFELGEDGRLRYAALAGPGQVQAVRQAARICPMQAITVTERE